MKTTAHILMAFVLMCATFSCSKTEDKNLAPKQTTQSAAATNGSTRSLDVTDPAPLNFSENQLSAVYFDFHLFTLQLKKIIDEPIALNPPFIREPAELYVYDVRTVPGVPHRDLYPVTSAIGDPQNTMLWTAIKIRFNQGFPAQQFYSREEIFAASQGVHPSITLTPAGVVYEGRLFDLMKVQPDKPDRAS